MCFSGDEHRQTQLREKAGCAKYRSEHHTSPCQKGKHVFLLLHRCLDRCVIPLYVFFCGLLSSLGSPYL